MRVQLRSGSECAASGVRGASQAHRAVWQAAVAMCGVRASLATAPPRRHNGPAGRCATVRDRFRVPLTSQHSRQINTIGIHTITHLIDSKRRVIIRCVTTQNPTRGVILPL